MLLVYHFPFSQAAPPVSLPPSVGCDVENRLRHATQTIRVSEFFKDYDPLRTGFITSEPFVIIIVAIHDTDLCDHFPSLVLTATLNRARLIPEELEARTYCS